MKWTSIAEFEWWKIEAINIGIDNETFQTYFRYRIEHVPQTKT